MPESRAKLYLAEVLLAIEDLHKRDIVYRDLKPDNVVIDNEGHAVLTDFGLAKENVADMDMGAKSFCGSLAYMAPEVVTKQGHGKAVDWYLLGIMLYQLVSGKLPFFEDNQRQMLKNILKGTLRLPVQLSDEGKSLLNQLFKRNPERRLGSGFAGVEEIKSHAFFRDIDWSDVAERKLPVPKPRQTVEQARLKFEKQANPK